MTKHEIITGQKTVWQIQNKTGEGDAGEIYRVASLSGTQTAFLKRPAMSAFRGDIFRQSSQIRNEAGIIQALNDAVGFDPRLRVAVPLLLDQSRPGPEYNVGNFIVIEKAGGLDLGTLARVARKGLAAQEEQELTATPEGRALLQEIAAAGRIPETLLVDILNRLAHYLDYIHHLQSRINGKESQGIIWNDVKPDHLFWDPAGGKLTIIDWGNARFLEADQTTLNRQFSWMDDFRQFFDEMGKFLGENCPELIEKLGWNDFARQKTFPPKVIEEIKTRLSVMHRQVTQVSETNRLDGEVNTTIRLDVPLSNEDIQKIKDQIAEFDLKPDTDGSLLTDLALKQTAESRFEDMRKLSKWAASLPGASAEAWRVIEILASLASQPENAAYAEIIPDVVGMAWEDVMWKTAAVLAPSFRQPFPEWWPDLTLCLRRLGLASNEVNVRPLEAVWRVFYTLQAQVLSRPEGRPECGEDFSPEYARQVMNQFTTEVIPNWTMLDPTPPDSRLEYRFAMQTITEALSLLPEREAGMAAHFSAAVARIDQALGYWEKKNFEKAAEALHSVLLLDPDRLRVLPALEKIRACGEWLRRVEAGPGLEEDFSDWISEIEFTAIELRSQVGPASWLERILDACRQLRQGVWPADLLTARPDFFTELPWLAAYDRRDKLSLPGDEKPAVQKPAQVGPISGPARIGLDEAVALVGPLDTWVPEARGSSARVVSGLLQIGQAAQAAAIKLMRMDQIHFALPLFREEAVILAKLADVPGVAKMIECGFIQLDEGSEFPLQPGHGHPQAQGRVERIAPNETPEFLSRISDRIAAGWTPYLAIEKQEQDENLLFLCDAGQTRGRYQPTVTLLKMAVQICDVLEASHARGIVYRDHKILHYYWKDIDSSLTMIDWNVARFHPDGLKQTDIEMDIVQFGARGLHHILTGRTAPGALPLGPTRPEEIDAAAQTYKTQWTYDDRRLPTELQEILEKVLSGGYTSIPDLRDDLKKTIIKKPNTNTAPA
jgi:serine/threonine protein kinase